MARILALEWNESEARMVVAATRGDRAVVEQAFSVVLRAGPAAGQQSEASVGERIATAMAARSVGRLDALVAVGRSNIELRQLSLPPAPDEELPDLVRFQAMREFNELDERWLLDFVPIDEATDQPRTVLAAAIDPELVAQIDSTCQTAGVKPRRLVLRPCAAASLLCRAQAGARMQVRLLVDLLGDEADLTVMIDRKVIFLRTARLPGDPLAEAESATELLAQIRRTMAAVQNRLDGRRVACIVLCGQGPEHAALAKSIDDQLATPTELFDPFDGLTLGAELQRGLPDHPGRFAPLLGMVLDELQEVPPAVDFLHPRRPPALASKRSRLLVVGVAAAALIVLFLAYRWYCRYSLGTEVTGLEGELQQLDVAVKKAEKAAGTVGEIEKWTATDVVWLDELCRLADKLPPAREAMLTELVAGPNERGGGEIRIEGLAQSATTIDQLEQRLRDKTHRVEGHGRAEDKSQKFYSWRFSSSLLVPPEEP
jgi:Tfp pilus assembly PilM family ATPase